MICVFSKRGEIHAMSVEVTGVSAGSVAERVGMTVGDLISINGHFINDVLDYEYYSAVERLQAVFIYDGSVIEYELVKDQYEPLGLEFAGYLMDGQHHCRNNCIFCFIDQLPKGLRQSLYFKDDDERLSFLFGNYITLTNLSEHEAQRIIDLHISPINISVHTTDPELRVRMMRNKNAGSCLGLIDRFAAAGIEMNCQIVLCRGINDGAALKNTISDLARLWPHVASVAVVPVGLTAYRQDLYELQPWDAESAAATLDLIEGESSKLLASCGSRMVYPSDEWFLLAGRELPPEEYYGEMRQLENGVGMLAKLTGEFRDALAARRGSRKKHCCDIATGALAAPTLRALVAEAVAKFPNAQCRVHTVQNDFFGRSITVTGLLTAADISAQVTRENMLGDTLYLCEDVLRREGDMLLDSVTPQQLEQQMNVKVVISGNSGDALLAALTGSEE